MSRDWCSRDHDVYRIGCRRHGESFNDFLETRRSDRRYVEELVGRMRTEPQATASDNATEGTMPDDANIEEDVFWDIPSPQSAEEHQATTVEEQESDWADMPFHDRILYYAMYTQHFGLSGEEIKRMEELMYVIYGSPPPITYHEHVIPLNESLLEQYNRKRYYFCSSCNQMLNEWKDMCQNGECPLYRVHIKRAKTVQRIEVQVLDILPQLSDLLTKYIREIIGFHRILHENGGGPAHDRSDIRFFDGFYRKIETSEEFDSNRLRILMSLSIDGFVPKRITRSEVWPLYLRVDNIPKCEADKYVNSMLSGMYYSLVKPNDQMVEVLFSRIESEMKGLQEVPIEIEVDGTVWTLEIRLHRGVADMGAQKALFGVPRWNSEYGCSKCYLKGQHTGRHHLWISREEDNVSLRPVASFLEDGQVGANGIPKETSVMRLITPRDFPADALHVCSEGVTKDRLRDLFDASSKFPELRIDRVGIERIKESLKNASSHTYSNSLILSLDDLKSCKAAELDELTFVLFPLVAAVPLIEFPLAAASLLGYWLCLRIISRTSSLTTAAIEKAQYMARLTKEIWKSIAPGIFTMKCHWFFDHAMSEEVETYGSAYQWSSAPFESHHRRLQIRVNQSTVNSSTLIIERYLLYKKIRFLFEDRSSNNQVMVALKNKVDNRHKARFPVGVPVTESIYFPKGSRVEPGLLHEDHKVRIARSGEHAYSRLVIDGKVYASRIYWRRPSHTRQDIVYMKGNDGLEEVDAFASILLFLYNNRTRSVRVLVDEFRYCSPFLHLANLVHHNPHPLRRTGIRLMDCIEENNVFFQELKENVVRVRPVSLIRGAGTLLQFHTHQYASLL